MRVSLYLGKKLSFLQGFLLLLLASAGLAQNVNYSSLATPATFAAKSINVSLPVGSLAGSAGASGGASYSIPIAVPPGTNGIAPSLSVEYNSMGGNGLLGMGWNLSGLSAITRVARTVYHDGAAGPVELSANDRFALDGARFISTNTTQTYGSDGTIYATESESFATITSVGTQGSGPVSFVVLAKDGTKMEFGNTASSRFVSQTGNAVMVWRLNKIRYPDGNYIEYEYTDTSTERDSRIAAIKYTGNDTPGSSLAPYNVIEFAYKIRSDIRTTYEGGSSVLSKYLLDLITVKAEGTVVKKYQFDYGYDTINSFLKSVTEFGSDNTPLNPTIFKYGDTPVETTTINTAIPGGNGIQAVSGDYDGDGKQEILAAHQSSTSLDISYFDSFSIYKANATGTGYTQIASQTLTTGSTLVNKQEIPNSKTFLPSDFTGDGLDDILMLNISNNGTESKLENITIYESTNGGTSFVSHIRSVQPNYYRIPLNNKFFYLGDFDGDGISEYITILGNVAGSFEPFLCSNYIAGGSCGSIAIPGTTSFPPTTWATASDINTLDFNGDGKTDLMLIKNNICEVFTFEGNTAIRLYNGTFPIANQYLFFGDFNGDGKTDLIQAPFDFSSVTKAISTGDGFNQSSLALVQSWPSSPPVVSQSDNIIVGDYNGDGKSDLYYKWSRIINYPNSTGYDIHTFTGTDIYYSQGDSFTYKQLSYLEQTQEGYGRPSTVTYIVDSPVDFNGDGKTDLVSSGGTNLYYTLFNKDGTNNLLQKVSNGFNHVTEWVYQNLTAGGSFYQKGVGNYPVNSIQPALYAVSEFKSQNGIGGISTIQYSYSDARFHRAGKGLLGFTSVSTTNLITGYTTVSANEFNTTFFALAPKSTTINRNGLMSQTTLTNEWVPLGNKRYWYRVNGTHTDNYFEKRTSNSSNTYDTNGNVTISTADNGVETTTTTTQFGQFGTPIAAKPTTTTTRKTRGAQTPYEVTTTFEYNTLGQITKKTDFSGLAQNVVTTYGYNTLGNLTNTSVTPAGMSARTASSTYDAKGRFTLSSTNVLGQSNSATYDAKWGKPLTSTGIDGLTTSYQYDAWGRTTQTSLPEGYAITQSWGWDQTNGAVYYNQVQHPGKPDVKTWMDVLGREVKKETEGFNGLAITQSQTYDARGNVATSIQPHNANDTQVVTTATSYDDYNRASSVNVTGMGTTSIGYNYDVNGKLTITTTNPAGQASSKETDASGQTISATDNGGILTYIYNSQGNLLSVKQGSATPVVHEYDDYGRQTKLIDQNAGTTTYVYNAAGELTQQTNANGKVSNLVYDSMGRVTTRTGTEGTTATEYYPAGTAAVNQIKKVTGFAGNVTEYTYDGYGRLSSSTETIDNTSYTTGYVYNTYGDVTKKIYPSGFYTNHAYDGNGFATVITNSSNDALFTAVTQNGQGQPLLFNRGNGKTTSMTYEYGMPKQYYTQGVQDLKLTWDLSTGNLTKRKDDSHTTSLEESFTYDNLNRLTGSTVLGLTGQAINYSANGNISSKTDAGTYSYLAGKPNAVLAVTNPTNVILALQQDIIYTAFLQPEKLTENNYELTYTYGADYNRIKGILKQNNTLQRTRYYVGPGYEKDLKVGSPNRDIHYIDSPAGLIAIVVVENNNLATAAYHYVYTDHLGSILTVTNAGGTVEFEQNFDAWGRRRDPITWAYTGVSGTPDWLYRGYTGHEHLMEFNLINMNGRLYDPVVGRVLSPDNFVQDPFSTQGFNRYSYGFNNPLKYTDPDGNNPLLGALIGALGYTLSVAFSDGGFNNWDWGQFAFSAISGAVTAGFATGIGEVAQGITNPILQASFQVAAHGLVGGFVSSAQGGEFGRGFLTSAAGSLMGSATGGLNLKGAAMIGASAITGGTISAVFGGNFWQGAAQAGIVTTFNHVAHQLFDPPTNQGGDGPEKPSLEDMKKNPPNHPEYESPRGGDRKVRNPNGSGSGWIDKKGRIWVPDDHKGTHAPHWDRQEPKGGNYTPVYPFVQRAIDPGMINRIGEAVGLSGTALTIYLIISEGSRLFPPRNLIPIP
ncbi:FG-GAP-like repeat-containing protein [Spirosoma jeollabukense]